MDARAQLSDSHVSISNNTILRIIKKTKPIINYHAANIAIDDFSCHKRKTYYTILVDNDTGKRLEVLPSRHSDEVVKMLKKFKHVKTVTRDFSKTYKAAIEEALPNAKQIVDRFHVLKNLTDDISGYISLVSNPILPMKSS